MSVLRTPSQVEADRYQQFREVNGIENTELNATRLCEPILTVGQQINQATLKVSFDMVRGQLTFESAAQREYNTIAALFTQAQLDQFESWLAHQRLVSDESDQGLSNRALILEQLRGRDFNALTMGQAVSRVANNAKRPLHIKPEPTPESFGRHTNTVFQKQESVKLSIDNKTSWDDQAQYTNGRKNHSHNPALQPKKVSAPTQDYWKTKAESVQGDRAHETDQLRRIFVTTFGLKMNAYSDSVDWKQTFEAREAAYREIRRVKEGGR